MVTAVWINYQLSACILETSGPMGIISFPFFLRFFFSLWTQGLTMSNTCCLSSFILYFQGSALLWEGSWLLLFLHRGKECNQSVSKRMSCDVDPFQSPALTKPMARNEVSPCCWAVASFLKDSPVSWQSVSWPLSGKWRLEAPYIKLRDLPFNKAVVERNLSWRSFLYRFPEDRQNVKKSFVFFY